VQSFTFAICRDQTFSHATITVSDLGAGQPVSPTKVKALAVSITKRNLDFLRVEDFGKDLSLF
jgi:hypothetical protein